MTKPPTSKANRPPKGARKSQKPSGPKAPQHRLSLTIGAFEVTLAEKTDKTVKVATVPLDGQTLTADRVERLPELAAAIKEAVKSLGSRTRHVTIIARADAFTTRSVPLPNVPAEDVRNAMTYVAQQNMPITPGQAVTDYCILNASATGTNADASAMLFGAHRTLVSGIAQAAHMAGLLPVSFEPPVSATLRASRHLLGEDTNIIVHIDPGGSLLMALQGTEPCYVQDLSDLESYIMSGTRTPNVIDAFRKLRDSDDWEYKAAVVTLATHIQHTSDYLSSLNLPPPRHLIIAGEIANIPHFGALIARMITDAEVIYPEGEGTYAEAPVIPLGGLLPVTGPQTVTGLNFLLNDLIPKQASRTALHVALAAPALALVALGGAFVYVNTEHSKALALQKQKQSTLSALQTYLDQQNRLVARNEEIKRILASEQVIKDSQKPWINHIDRFVSAIPQRAGAFVVSLTSLQPQDAKDSGDLYDQKAVDVVFAVKGTARTRSDVVEFVETFERDPFAINLQRMTATDSGYVFEATVGMTVEKTP